MSKIVEFQDDIQQNISDSQPDFLYVGVDGVMTPLNQKQGYKEAKVGVIFWNKDYQKGQKKRRGIIRKREYVATLKSRNEFRNRVSQLYNEVGKNQKTKTIVIGDGAHWIWEMAQEQLALPNLRCNLTGYNPAKPLIYKGFRQRSLPKILKMQ